MDRNYPGPCDSIGTIQFFSRITVTTTASVTATLSQGDPVSGCQCNYTIQYSGTYSYTMDYSPAGGPPLDCFNTTGDCCDGLWEFSQNPSSIQSTGTTSVTSSYTGPACAPSGSFDSNGNTIVNCPTNPETAYLGGGLDSLVRDPNTPGNYLLAASGGVSCGDNYAGVYPNIGSGGTVSIPFGQLIGSHEFSWAGTFSQRNGNAPVTTGDLIFYESALWPSLGPNDSIEASGSIDITVAIS